MILRPLSRNISGRPRLLTIFSRKCKKIWAQMIGPKHNIRGGLKMSSLTLLSQLFLVILLVGCEDIIELEKQSYVIAIGIDQTEQEGIYQFTFQIANPISSD